MSSGALGLATMQNEFSTLRMRSIWNDKNRLKKICEVERTLATVQAELGMIPQEAADRINKVCRVENINMRDLQFAYAKSGHFLSGFVKYMQELLGEEAGEYIHYGVTSQDVLDTAMILQLQDAHKILVDYVAKIARELLKIIEQHKHTVAVGRGHGNHSPATTIGFRAAVYLNQVDRYLTRLRELESFVFTGVISGVVGTYAAMGELGPLVEEKVLTRLGLNVPDIFWHSQRDRFVEYGHALTMVSGMLQKMGQNLFDLSRTEIGEFTEFYNPDRQASTTVPSKRNPYICEAVVNLGDVIRNQMNLLYGSMRAMGEKETITWRNIWVAVPDICMYMSAQLNYSYLLLRHGTFNEDNIRRNLNKDGGAKMSERIMFDLGKHIGKQTAHEVMYQVTNLAHEKGITFETALKQNETMQTYYTSDEMADLLAPETYLGHAVAKTEQVESLFREHHPSVK